MLDKDKLHAISESVALAFVDSIPFAPVPTPEPALRPGQIQRRRSTDFFGPASTALLHLVCAALDEIDYALILVDERGTVAHANHRAQCDLQDGRLRLDRGRLYAAQASQQMPFQTALERARRGTRSLVDLSADETRPQASQMYALIPFGAGRAGSGGASPVLVVSGRQCLSEALSTQFFAARFGLSRSEQAVLQGLVTGLSAEEVALDRGLAVSTVRSQIKDIRRKTQCRSMRDLLAKVAMLPPVMS